ncbi:MAG TPA: hypothetical protein VE861_06755 [Gemmatimonadaceae bacterium]|nr:hypothetical protein [Gemmatimonadaceae bacterium]
MNAKPLGPAAHGVLDYAFAGMHAMAPTLFNLRGRARTVCYCFAASHAGIAALTDYPAGVRRTIPFDVHGKMDLGYLPALLAVPAMVGALRQRNALRYFATMFAVGSATWLLTDFSRGSKRRTTTQKLLPRTVEYSAPQDAGADENVEAIFAS